MAQHEVWAQDGDGYDPDLREDFSDGLAASEEHRKAGFARLGSILDELQEGLVPEPVLTDYRGNPIPEPEPLPDGQAVTAEGVQRVERDAELLKDWDSNPYAGAVDAREQVVQPPGGAYIIDGYRREYTVGLTAGFDGTGKSQGVREMALRFALGDGMLFGAYEVVRQGRVLILDADNGEADEWSREVAILNAMGKTREDLPPGSYIRKSFPVIVGLNTDKGKDALEAAVVQYQPDLLVLDVGPSWVETEMGESLRAVVDWLKQLAWYRKVNIEVCVWTTKPRKTDKGETHRQTLENVYGHWSKPVQAATLLQMENGDPDLVRISVHKRVPYSAYLCRRGGVFELVQAVVETPHGDMDERDRLILDYLWKRGESTADDIAEGAGVPRSAVFRRLNGYRPKAGLPLRPGLSQRGMVNVLDDLDGTKATYTLTEEGRKPYLEANGTAELGL